MSPFRREHDFPEDPDGAWKRCGDCGKTLPADAEELPLCPGPPEERNRLERSAGLERTGRLRSVSPDRERKKSSSVTGERLVDGPVCGWAKGRRCFLASDPRHECELVPGRDAIEPAHVESKGSGHFDWRVGDDGRVYLNVVPACAKLHDVLDGHREPEPDLTRDDVKRAAERAARELTDDCPVEPPEHFRKKARGELF